MVVINHANKLEKILNESVYQKIEIDLDKDFYEQFEEIVPALQSIIKPVIYWFECKSLEDAQFLKERYCLKRKEINKSSPPPNNHFSNIIYLGVRQGGSYKRTKTWSRIRGRVFHHYGLYDNPRTQGLQLEHWAKGSGKKIYLNIIQLEIEEIQYLYILEKLFSIELKPMLGRH